jgi:hypothetical protein
VQLTNISTIHHSWSVIRFNDHAGAVLVLRSMRSIDVLAWPCCNNLLHTCQKAPPSQRPVYVASCMSDLNNNRGAPPNLTQMN